jgi:RNA polymerase sigma-70 factor, ECF subfamily
MKATQPEFLANPVESPVRLWDDGVSPCATFQGPLHAPEFTDPDTPASIDLRAQVGADVPGEAEQMRGRPSSLIESFNVHRQMVFRIARRILGSVSDAEDMVQELWLRWQRQDAERIQSARAWLGSTMTRLCIDQLRSARRQREDSYGLRVPEPMMTEVEPEMEHAADQQYSLGAACAKMLEALRPMERAVFTLHEVLGYDYSAAAAIVGKDVANCRQILHRAKVHLRENSHAFSLNEPACRLAKQISIAADTGELTVLLALLQGEC